MKHLLNRLSNSISLLFIVLVFSVSGLTAQTFSADNSSFENTYKRSIAIVNSNSYEFRSYLVFNGEQREKNASKLAINKNKLSGTLLPTSASNNSAISFKNNKVKQYKVQLDDGNHSIEITFDTELEGVVYQFNIKTMPNGKTFLKVNSNQHENELEYIGDIIRI